MLSEEIRVVGSTAGKKMTKVTNRSEKTDSGKIRAEI